MNCLSCAKITLIFFLLYILAITQSSAADSSVVVEINKVQLSLRIQPLDSGKKIVTDPKAFNQLGDQEFPDMIDNRGLVSAPDGSFSYSGPMTYQYGNGKRLVSYTGHLDLDKWTFKAVGTWSYSVIGNGFYGAYTQEDKGEFKVEAPIGALDESRRSAIKIRGTVKTSYRDEKNGNRTQVLPLTTQTRRRLTDDVQVRIIYRNPEYLKPEYKTTGGPELYEAGEELTRDAYKKLAGKR